MNVIVCLSLKIHDFIIIIIVSTIGITHLYLLYRSYIGQNIVFQWVEKIREELRSLYSESIDILKNKKFINIKSNTLLTAKENSIPCPIINHGEIISDRRSIFQGHAAVVHSICQVRYAWK
jgi:hypothetical protein